MSLLWNSMSAFRIEINQYRIGISSIIKITQLSLSEEHMPQFHSRALALNQLLHFKLQGQVRAVLHGGSPALPVKPFQWSATNALLTRGEHPNQLPNISILPTAPCPDPSVVQHLHLQASTQAGSSIPGVTSPLPQPQGAWAGRVCSVPDKAPAWPQGC